MDMPIPSALVPLLFPIFMSIRMYCLIALALVFFYFVCFNCVVCWSIILST